jgi:uncharacterized protein YjbJ (UPF0337 family)
MSTLDKVAGRTKQVVAEIIGDARLQREGKTQARKATAPEADADNDDAAPTQLNPFKRLDQLT